MGSLESVEERIPSRVNKGEGEPLPGGLRGEMETAFGANFENVRVHTDSRASSMAASIGALAFTSGQDIFFRQGEYSPGTSSGVELVAHELAHVVQQREGSAERLGQVVRATRQARD